MCDLVGQSIIFGLVNGIFNYGSVYILCKEENKPTFCPNPNDVNVINFLYGFFGMFVLYFVVSWLNDTILGGKFAVKILLLTLIAVFGVLFYMSYIGKQEKVTFVSLVTMLAASYFIFWILVIITNFISEIVCSPDAIKYITTFNMSN